MRDDKTIPIIAAIITAIASIVVAVINSNTMKNVLLTEISATQSAEAYFTALAYNATSTVKPTLTPFQPIATAQEYPTQEPVLSASPIPVPTSTMIPAPQSQPIVPTTIPSAESDDRLTFRFYELSIILFFIVVGIVFAFAIYKTINESGTILRAIPFSLIMISPLLLLWIRYTFSFPTLSWTTILFSTFLPVSVLFWLVLFEIIDINMVAIIFVALAIIAPFILAFGFTFWPLGAATLNALLAVGIFGSIAFASLWLAF